MRAALAIPWLVFAAIAVSADEPIDFLPPIDATSVTRNSAGRWQPRRLPPAHELAANPATGGWLDEDRSAAQQPGIGLAAPPPSPTGPPISPVSYPRSLSEPLLADIPDDEPLAPHVSSYKNGVFQKLSFTGTWLARPNRGDVGVSLLELFGSFAFPFPTVQRPLVITPGFGVYFIDGPSDPAQDLPPQLYDAYLEFRWINKFGERFLADLAISPGVHSDFEQWSDSALRYTGRAIAVWTFRPRLKIVLGVIYLDRDDVSMLPAAGIIWTPTDDWSLELVSPRPRIARRFFYDGLREDWFYIGGELGGGSWSIERASLVPDVLTSRDYRVLLGIERKRPGGAGAKFEVGWVFAREFEYASDPTVIQADATVMLRGAIAY